MLATVPSWTPETADAAADLRSVTWVIAWLPGETHALAFSDPGPIGTWGIVRLADDWFGADDYEVE